MITVQEVIELTSLYPFLMRTQRGPRGSEMQDSDRKIEGALDQAAPLQNWTLPEPLQHLRRLLESRMGNRGKREFIQALRLIEVFPETLVAAAALDASGSARSASTRSSNSSSQK
jgi:hypothetical protein